jgi:hypothetical protein
MHDLRPRRFPGKLLLSPTAFGPGIPLARNGHLRSSPLSLRLRSSSLGTPSWPPYPALDGCAGDKGRHPFLDATDVPVPPDRICGSVRVFSASASRRTWHLAIHCQSGLRGTGSVGWELLKQHSFKLTAEECGIPYVHKIINQGIRACVGWS